MSPPPSRAWMTHTGISATVFLLGLGVALPMVTGRGAGELAGVAVMVALAVSGVAGLYVLVTSAAAAVVERLRPRGLSVPSVVAIHAVALGVTIGGPFAWPALSDALDRVEDDHFADCVTIQSCTLEAATDRGEAGYTVRLGVDACRSVDIGVNLRAASRATPGARVRSRASSYQTLERGPGELHIFVPAAGPVPPDAWTVDLWAVRTWLRPFLGPSGGFTRWNSAEAASGPGASDRAPGRREGRTYRTFPACTGG